jgi:hypothetical protein
MQNSYHVVKVMRHAEKVLALNLIDHILPDLKSNFSFMVCNDKSAQLPWRLGIVVIA